MESSTVPSALGRTNNSRGNATAGPDPREVPNLVTRYISQLENGCGNDTCTQVLCRTGMLNTSHGKPIRKYTIRSARTIAISLCATPTPRAHLCRYMSADSEPPKPRDFESPGDPSALDQILSDTQSFKLLQGQDALCFHDHELQAHHAQVSKLLEVAGKDGEGCLSDTELVQGLLPSTEWLLDKVPLRRKASFRMVNELISKGFAYPTKNKSIPVDESYNNWLAILDTLHHKPYLRLLGRIVKALALRQALNFSKQNQDRTPRKSLLASSGALILLRRHFTARKQSSEDELHCRFLALVLWIKRLTAEHWDGQPLVRLGSICLGAWSMLTFWGYPPLPRDPCLPQTMYFMPMVWMRLSANELAKSYCETSTYGLGTDFVHILSFNSLFDMERLTHCFRSMNHFKMRDAHSTIERSINLMRRYDRYPDEHAMPEQSRHSTKHYLLLNVSRAKILQDTFDQLWQRRRDELKRPLRVRLGEVEEHEIGHDLGGVQMEFFNLLCKAVFLEEAQMFVTDPETGASSFRSGSLQPLYMFELFGILMALAIYNGITLPITLPWIFYRELQGYPDLVDAHRAIDAIRGDWPALARSMQSVLDEDIPGLETAFPFEANGIRMQALGQSRSDSDARPILSIASTMPEVDIKDIAEELPGWKLVKATNEPEEVTPESKDKYVAAYILYTAFVSVEPQWRAFKRGFHNSGILDAKALDLFDPSQLKALVEGSSRLDLADLRRIAQYDGYRANDPYMHMFWRVIGSWPEEKQKQLLKFVTAAERIPITGVLTFVIKRFETENTERLPTSSTCFGTLMLPLYRSERVLVQKLSLALKYGTEGFGTG